jgi:hypothetical protein
MTDALWVVDGQQRISSLVRVLVGAGYPSEEFSLFFDLENETFLHPHRGQEIPSHFVPLTDVLDSEHLIGWLLKSNANIDRAGAIRLGKRIREYQIPAYLVTTPNESTVREIFRRTNSYGKPMDDSDVFNAIHGARGGARPSDLREVSDLITKLGFGEIDNELLYRMMRSTLGTDISKGKPHDIPIDRAQQAIHDVERAARSVVGFLQRDVGIPHISLLPYEQPLITLTRFFWRYPEPGSRSRELLARWLWRGALSGQHRGDTISTRETLEAISDGEDEAVQRLLGTINRQKIKSLPLDRYSFGYARGRIQTLALLALKPRHLLTGTLLPINGPQEESVVLPPLVVVDRGNHRNSLANRLLHAPIKGGLRRAIIEAQDLDVLASHAISEDAQRFLRDGQIDQFIRQREMWLRKTVEGFVEVRARWEESDRPPLTSLMVPDED